MLTPRRYRGIEHLDDPATGPVLRERSLRDVRRANTLLGGTRAVLSEFDHIVSWLGLDATLLDIGTGLADIPARASQLAARHEVRLTVFGVDEAVSLLRAATPLLDAGVCADARRLPFADSSVDVVTCSQLLHHFEDEEIPLVLSEMNRVARIAAIVSDLRRSWFAAGGFWLAAWPLGFHPVTRHDGVTSVLRGFTATELAAHVLGSTGETPAVRRHLGFRLSATWRPSL
jgi:2-polyprenyl-3-methyl-5-hydroxy-6-metoxy-1,4-benzoquinol methylase